MSYRVETALSKRAGCQATECKNNGVKIDKDELRLGIWVEYGDRGGWSWRHWGCVTGKVLQGLRNLVVDPDKPGEYNWDMLDGFESGDKNSLDRRPELQEKIRRCITQGFIDPEDFNGDPEMNVLGTAGLHTAESKKKMKNEKKEKANTEEAVNLKAHIAAMTAEKADGGDSDLAAKIIAAQAELDKLLSVATPASKKRVKNEAEADEGTPAKKKRATKKKTTAKIDENESEVEDLRPAKPAVKSRVKKVKKEEEDDEDVEETKPAPAKKSRAKKSVRKGEEGDDKEAREVKPAPTKKPRNKRIKKEEDTEMSEIAEDRIGVKSEEDVAESSKPITKKRTPAKKRGVKAEADEDTDSAVKVEQGEGSVKPTAKKRAARGKKAVKDEPTEDGADLNNIEAKPKPAAKKGRKKAVKEEQDDTNGVSNRIATDSSNPGITKGSSILSDAPDLPEDVKDEPTDVEAADEIDDAVVPTKKRRTRSRTTSSKSKKSTKTK